MLFTRPVMELVGAAFAQGSAAQPGAAPGAAPSLLGSPLLLFGGIFVIFYFLLIRPQQRQAKDKERFIASLKKGDEVITAGGLYGRVHGIADRVITLEIAENVRVKVARDQIAGPKPAEKPA